LARSELGCLILAVLQTWQKGSNLPEECHTHSRLPNSEHKVNTRVKIINIVLAAVRRIL